MTRITVHIGDQIHEVGMVSYPEPALVALMVRDWADDFQNPEEDDL